MRAISPETVKETVAALLAEGCVVLPEDVRAALREALAKAPENSRCKTVLDLVNQNSDLAIREKLPVCQDTGTPVVFIELGAQCCLESGTWQEAVDSGVKEAAEKAYLRRSIVRDPLDRVNTGTNTPSSLTIIPAEGEKLKITILPKGAGCENMTRLKMLRPADGQQGVYDFVLQCVKESGGNACPPLTVGVGVGGDATHAALMAKHALTRDLNQRNPKPLYAELETRLIEELNASGQGPLGLGGAPTVLDLFIEEAPCHIASLPVAVCLNCHAARRASKEI